MICQKCQTVKMSIKKLQAKALADGRPDDYVASVLATGMVDGDWLLLEPEALDAYQGGRPVIYTKAKTATPLPPEVIVDPSILKKAKSLGVSILQWAKSGFKTLPEKIVSERRRICADCPNWQVDAFAGMGKCKICGCSGIKHVLPNEKCPANPPKWGAVI